MDRTLTIESPSKINVFLEVCARRADGFHELETVMLRTDLLDVLSLTPRNDATIVLEWSPRTPAALRIGIPLDESNLIVRAARALQQHSDSRAGVHITLQKRIPAQAGLAGGSGNAAACLLGLNRLWNLHLPVERLHEIAATLGSDLNFLLSGVRAARCTGR
ncbi:MAG: 4-(cytidine 5'-diphospho)-2-C-methyl-D-erythritol kinase, partial [Planctomycetaceae bacterium]|nr:4-(cytidine 5'-diphospho)-2-C-methyl-D-erythritol kinase [Planctomycetaceae bacterium]